MNSRSVMRRSAAFASLVLVTAAIGCSSGGSSSGSSSSGASSYNIAFVGDLTGSDSGQAGPAQAGFLSAVKYIDAHGGAGGHMINVTSIDAQSDVTAALGAYQKATSGTYIAISGLTLSNELDVAIPTLKQASTAMVSLNTPDPSLISQPWYWTVSTQTEQAGQSAMNAAKSLLGGSLSGKRIAIAMLSAPSGDVILSQMEAYAKTLGATVVAVSRDPATTSSYTSQAAKIAAAKPDVIFTYNTDAVTALADKGLDAAGLTNVPIVALSPSLDPGTLATEKLGNVYALFDARPLAPNDIASAALTAAGYNKSDGQSELFGRAWAAAWVLDGALSACGDQCTSTKLSALIPTKAFPVVGSLELGPVKFTESQHTGITAMQAFNWDSSTAAVTAAGPVIPLG
jgi:branched-chain amino acid transport system substrate-binding protein